MSLGLEAETSQPTKDELRIPEPLSRRAFVAFLFGLVLFVANLSLMEYDFITATGSGPGGYTPGIVMMIIAPAVAFAAWLYASHQALRTFCLCLFPPAGANAATWWGLNAGHTLNLESALTAALITLAIWLVLMPLLALWANNITGGTPVKQAKTKH